MNDLYSLWILIRENGLHNIANRIEMSSDYTKMMIVYRDSQFNEQFIFIERKRGTGYRISADKPKHVVFSTLKKAYAYLHDFLMDMLQESRRFEVMTVAEYSQLVGKLRLSQYKELKQRLIDLDRFEKYWSKKNQANR